MPGGARLTVTWCAEGIYELSVGGAVERQFRAREIAAWQAWLAGITSLRFCGSAGTLGLYREARRRGGAYWYAYHIAEGRTRKRYLGATSAVTLARLEEIAGELARPPSPAMATPAPQIRPPDGWPGADDVAGAFPAAKLAAPQPPPAQIPRERLLAALDAAPATRLTLVVAPAGWGKSTALAAWAARHPDRVAWLALEEADDNPARFWSAVIAALRTRLPGVGATALALLRSPQPPPLAAVVTALVNDMVDTGAGEPIALLLDDFHLLAVPAIGESVAFLLAHLPARLRLIVASRVDPDLSLARLRARGQLVEIRAADLRFDEGDTAAFMRRALDAPLGDGEVAALAARTEGWAAGLQLAALALRGQPDRAAWLARFTGGHRYLLDYVDDEILARQPPTIRGFLLRAAVLSRLGADLCAAVTGEADSRAILVGLERDNLFISPLGEGRVWYRLHDLFREALLARAAREPGLLEEAHRLAARWHADHGDGREAIEHALAGEEYDLAAALIAREAPALWLRGEARAVHEWLLLLPDETLLRHARLALDADLRLLESLHATAGAAHSEARLGVERLLGRVAAGLRPAENTAPGEVEAALLGRRVRLLRALLAARALVDRGDAPGLARLGEEVEGLAEGEEVRWELIRADLRFWLAFSMRHEGPRLIPELLTLQARALAEGEGQAALATTVRLAMVYKAAGSLDRVEQECLEGLALVARVGIQTSWAGYLHLFLAATHYDRNRPEEAETALRAAFPIARTWRQVDQLHFALWYQVHLALLRGDPAAADAALREAGAIVRREQSAYHAPWVAAARVRHWLATGDLAAAERWAARAAFDVRTWSPVQTLALLARTRVALARRRHAAALAALDDFAALLDRPGDIPTLGGYLALRLVAHHQAGERAQARATASRLLALTEPEGWTRVYLDEGAPMEAALAALLDAPGDDVADDQPLPIAYVSHLLGAFDDERQTGHALLDPAAGSLAGSPTPEVPRAVLAPVEPLTRREREVLRLLTTGASNAAIAEALSISPFTVKRHVGNLLGKLGATSRTGAVEHARRAGLL